MSNFDMNPAKRLSELHYGECNSEADGQSCYETISPSLVPINRLLKQRDDLADLCGEIIATLRLPTNQGEQIAKLSPFLEKWRVRYAVAAGNPNERESDT